MANKSGKSPGTWKDFLFCKLFPIMTRKLRTKSYLTAQLSELSRIVSANLFFCFKSPWRIQIPLNTKPSQWPGKSEWESRLLWAPIQTLYCSESVLLWHKEVRGQRISMQGWQLVCICCPLLSWPRRHRYDPLGSYRHCESSKEYEQTCNKGLGGSVSPLPQFPSRARCPLMSPSPLIFPFKAILDIYLNKTPQRCRW